MLGACLSWNEKLTPARWIRNYACIGIGFSIPIAGMLYWLYHIDALAAFYEIITQFLLQTYGSAIRQTELQSYYIRIIYLVLSSIFVFYYLWQNKKSLSTGEIKTNRLLFASLLYGCLHFVVQHKGWIYHLYPALALVIPCILYNVCLCVRYRGPYMHGHCVVLVFAFLMILVLLHPHSPQALRTEVALVRKNLDRIMHDVTATQKLLPESIENRHSAAFFDFVTFPNIVTRMGLGFRQKYFYSFFLYLKPDHPFTQRMRTEYMQGIRHTMPALIMVGADSLPYAHAFSFAAIDHHIWPEYSAFLEKHYRMAVRNNDYRIYARIH